VLSEAWGAAVGLRGLPDVVAVSRQLLAAAPELAEMLKSVGVRLNVISSLSSKSLSTAVNAAQNWAHGLACRGPSAGLPNLQALNDAAFAEHQERAGPEEEAAGARQERTERSRAFLALPHRKVAPLADDTLDWVVGPWLHAWEEALAAQSARHIETDEGIAYLMAIDEQHAQTQRVFDPERSAANWLVSAWPNPPADLSYAIGVSLCDLNWYLAGKVALEPTAMAQLTQILGHTGEAGELHPRGPCVLKPRTPAALLSAYEQLCGGAALEFAFECLPSSHEDSSTWRYVIFKACASDACNILMFPHDASGIEDLGVELPGFEGAILFNASVYRDLVASCARACVDALANRREAREFGERHHSYLSKVSKKKDVQDELVGALSR
jgi:hypothetical protein